MVFTKSQLAMLAGAMAIAAPVAAQPAAGAPKWLTQGDKLFGKPAKNGDPDGKDPASDISGLACAPARSTGRLCLVVDDESQGAQIIILTDDRPIVGDFIRLSTLTYESKPLELDAESVAWANGAFYVLGSHGRPRHGQGAEEQKNRARAQATRSLFEIRLDSDAVDPRTGKIVRPAVIRSSARLSEAISAQSELGPFFDKALEEGGVTIEGSAVKGSTLYVGFRGPVPKTEAAVLSIPLASLFDGNAPARGNVQWLPLGKDTFGKARGIRDLVAVDGGYVGIAGPMKDPEDPKYVIRPGDYAVFRWSGQGLPIVRDLGGFDAGNKPEALVPLGFDGGRMRALLLFDGPLNGAPRLIEQDFGGQGATGDAQRP